MHRAGAKLDCAALRRLRLRVATTDMPAQHMILMSSWGVDVESKEAGDFGRCDDYPARDRFLLRRPPQAHLPRMLVEPAFSATLSRFVRFQMKVGG